MKSIQVTSGHLSGRTIRFGRRAPDPNAAKLRFETYATALPTPPASVDYSPKAMSALSLIYLNDQLGDCVIAGGYHFEGLATANAGAPVYIATDGQITADYTAIGGYIPGNPSTDQGCDEITALNYWQNKGFANNTKLAGWLALNATSQLQVQQSLWLFESAFFGISLPDAWVNPFPSGNGFVWNDGTPDPENGHCVIGTGYNTSGIQIATWGMIGTLTWQAVHHLATAGAGGALYALLTPDVISKAQAKAPSGFDWATLIADFNALGGHIPAPAPVTPPAPSPSPTPVVKTHTLAEAQAILAAGW